MCKPDTKFDDNEMTEEKQIFAAGYTYGFKRGVAFGAKTVSIISGIVFAIAFMIHILAA